MAETAGTYWATEETYWGSRRVRLSAGTVEEDRLAAFWIKSVHAVAFLGERLLLVREHDAQWHFPGGRGEDDETPMETLAREMQEEAGAILRPPCLFAIVRVEFPEEPPPDKVPHTAYYSASVAELTADFPVEMRCLIPVPEAASLLSPLSRVLLREALKVKRQ